MTSRWRRRYDVLVQWLVVVIALLVIALAVVALVKAI